jgi:hypothetical protein
VLVTVNGAAVTVDPLVAVLVAVCVAVVVEKFVTTCVVLIVLVFVVLTVLVAVAVLVSVTVAFDVLVIVDVAVVVTTGAPGFRATPASIQLGTKPEVSFIGNVVGDETVEAAYSA